MALQRRSRVSARERAHKRGALAAVLVARRQELDLSQGELADLAGVARGPVVRLETGRPVSLEALLAILEVLGLHLDLVRGADPRGISVSLALAQQYDVPTTDEAGSREGVRDDD